MKNEDVTPRRPSHFASAVEWTEHALTKVGEVPFRDVEAYTVLSMAQHRLAHVSEARVALAKGIEVADTILPKLDSGDLGDDWIDWIIAHALLREAKALIERQPAAAGDQPKQK